MQTFVFTSAEVERPLSVITPVVRSSLPRRLCVKADLGVLYFDADIRLHKRGGRKTSFRYYKRKNIFRKKLDFNDSTLTQRGAKM